MSCFRGEVLSSTMSLKIEIHDVLLSTEKYCSHFSLLLLNISMVINFRNCTFCYKNMYLLHFLDIFLVKVFVISFFVMILNILIIIVLNFVSHDFKILFPCGLFLLFIFFSWFWSFISIFHDTWKILT